MSKRELTVSEAAAKGGKARALALSPQERQESARKAVTTRWARARKGEAPVVAPHTGIISIGELEIPCAVLEDGTRVLSETGVLKALGLYRSGAVHTRAKETSAGGAQLPLFVANKNLKPFIDLELASVLQEPIWYTPIGTGTPHKGVQAELLPKICAVWLRARDAGVIHGVRQAIVVVNADIIVRGLAEVGITALVDEATGFQDARARDALAKILEAFVAKELQRWVRTFPVEFYKEMFRLRHLPFNGTVKRPPYIGHVTNDLVYSRLAPGVLEELRTRNPVTETGRRRAKHHQWLTPDGGHPKLLQHLAAVTALMKASDSWQTFKRMLDRALPPFKEMPLFPGLED